MDPNTKVQHLPGVGTYLTTKLNKLGIETLKDLIFYFPFRYDDISEISQTNPVPSNEKINVKGVVRDIRNIRTRSGKFITKATVWGGRGTFDVIWFNQSYLTKNIKAEDLISLSGKAKMEGAKITLMSPSYEIIRREQLASDRDITILHTEGLVPVYSETEGITSRWLRTKIRTFLSIFTKSYPDYLPQEVVKNQKIDDLATALEKIHFPNDWEDIKAARKRLGFDELFLTQLISQQKRLLWQESKEAPALKANQSLVKEFILSLPFKLTEAQKKAYQDILIDISQTKAANRLLEGDVGSGKTIVAALAALIAHQNSYDVIFAAPTEILAFQHQQTLKETMSKFGVTVGIWTKSKKEVGDITCGTHALLTSFEPKNKIGLAIVDEQHRFGVAQRSKLFLNYPQKTTPHLLTMTATPIPRTLALTLYGDLSLSILDEMPLGRQKISTFVVPNPKRNDCYKFIQKEVDAGHQAFIITPFVEPSESMATIKAAKAEYEKLTKIFNSNPVIGLLHGRLKSKEKEEIINKFKKNEINILVSTPVVEVGIDIPNATIMMIESSDRFGLAQLHQLRGRVGRGSSKSYCFLFTDSDSANSLKRLKSMEKVHVGFELAEIDLKMRGPGEVFGLKQSGFENFKIADIFDALALEAAQKESNKLLSQDKNLQNYPILREKLKELEIIYSEPN